MAHPFKTTIKRDRPRPRGRARGGSGEHLHAGVTGDLDLAPAEAQPLRSARLRAQKLRD
jgi:hypothetical protein